MEATEDLQIGKKLRMFFSFRCYTTPITLSLPLSWGETVTWVLIQNNVTKPIKVKDFETQT